MVAEQAFLAPRATVEPSAVAAATMAVAAAGEIGGMALRSFRERQRERRARRAAAAQEPQTAPVTPMRQPEFVSPTAEAPAPSSVPQCSLTPLMTPAAAAENPPRPTVESEYKALADWKRGVKLRSSTGERSSLDRILGDHSVHAGIRPEAHPHVTAELARHLSVLEDAFVMTYDDTKAELENVGETLDVLLSRASEQVAYAQTSSDRTQGLELRTAQVESAHQTLESAVLDRFHCVNKVRFVT